MRIHPAVVCLFLIASVGPAQVPPGFSGNFGNVVFPGGTAATTPGVQRGFGNVVFPGGTSATLPGVQRDFGNVVRPGGGSAARPFSLAGFAVPGAPVLVERAERRPRAAREAMATPVSSEDRGRILQAIYQEIVPLIERHARERGFDVILNANCAFWASNFVDITSDIAALQ